MSAYCLAKMTYEYVPDECKGIIFIYCQIYVGMWRFPLVSILQYHMHYDLKGINKFIYEKQSYFEKKYFWMINRAQFFFWHDEFTKEYRLA